MKKNKAIFLFIVLLLCVYGCCRQVACPTFTEQEITWIPYRDGDTLVFKNFVNDSVITFHTSFYNNGTNYTKNQAKGPYSCYNNCYAFAQILITNNSANFEFSYCAKKTKDRLDVTIDQFGWVENKEKLWFDLSASIHHDSIKIADNWMYDIYEYASMETSPRVKKMFVKYGMGIIKYQFIDNQFFELIKYSKNEKNH